MPNTKIWARTVMLLAVALLGATALRAPTGFSFAAGKGGLQFEVKAAFVRIAFDIGQKCSISDRCSALRA
jgi:hypothetical protein